MTTERFIELMEGDSNYNKFTGLCRITAGLNIITKHCPGFGVEAADHDIVYSVDLVKIAESSITEEEVTTLREMGWFVDEETEGLAHFA